MSKRTNLEQQLENVKLAEAELNAALASVNANAVKAKLWDELHPVVKRAVGATLDGAPWDERTFQMEAAEIVLRLICGPDVRKHLEKFK